MCGKRSGALEGRRLGSVSSDRVLLPSKRSGQAPVFLPRPFFIRDPDRMATLGDVPADKPDGRTTSRETVSADQISAMTPAWCQSLRHRSSFRVGGPR